MNHVQNAHIISINSDAKHIMSELSLPDYAPCLNEIVKEFDEDDRSGTWVISIREARDIPFAPFIVMHGLHEDALKTAFCLQKVADLYHKTPRMITELVRIVRYAANFDFVGREPQLDDSNYFMSFPEFVASRRENVDDANSNWTTEPNDDQDHIKGFFYGPQNYRVLLTENEYTDDVGLVYQDWGYSDNNQIELEAMAYRCYLHALGYLNDDDLRDIFPHPFRNERRYSKRLTY